MFLSREFLEHGNRFFSEFPMPKSLISFAFQSNYVGIGLMCKRYTDLWFSTSFKGDVERDYNNHVESMMTPERKLVYQFFCLLNTHICDPTRMFFHIDYVLSIKDRLSINLTRETFKRSMKEPPATSANGILSTLNQIFDKKVGSTRIDALGDNELNLDKVPTVEEANEPSGEAAKLEKQHYSREG